MTDIIRPTTAQIPDALATEQEHMELLKAMTEAATRIPLPAIGRMLERMGQALAQEFPGIPQDGALAVIGTLAANFSATLLMQIEAGSPISNPERDGRVKAVQTFHNRLVARAVAERALVARADADGTKRIAQIFGAKH
jgi:hypothetical protein